MKQDITKYKAVIFDLFGTLVNKLSLRQHTGMLRQMASVVSVPSDDFVRLWFGTFNERGLGVFQNLEASVEYICERLGVHSDDARIKLAANINIEYAIRSIKPRPDAMQVLSYLKSHGYKTGLISNCSAEIPKILKNMPFAQLIDVAVFSSLVGMQKPDPHIYQLAAEQLAVKPATCLYIGDGEEHELTGAAQAAMHPVLIRDPSEDSTDVYRVNAEAEQWDGPVISSLKEVLTLLK
jgi:putative hydrolase of the HAD superfamily